MCVILSQACSQRKIMSMIFKDKKIYHKEIFANSVHKTCFFNPNVDNVRLVACNRTVVTKRLLSSTYTWLKLFPAYNGSSIIFAKFEVFKQFDYFRSM